MIIDSILQEDLEFIANSNLSFMQLKKKTVFITGSTGLIGSQLVRALAWCNKKHGLGIKIIALIRNSEKAFDILGDLSKHGVTFFKGDITNPNLSVMTEIPQIDYIIHAASITSSKTMVEHPTALIHTSLEGTKNMLELARNKGCSSFLYISSMEVYGSFDDGRYVSENDMGYLDSLNVRSNYPLCKRMCENMCIAYAAEFHLPVRIARLSQTFGAGILPGENRVFAQFARSVIDGTDIVLHTKGLSEGNYCYTRDTISALILMMVKGASGEAYNIANEDCHTSIVDMAKMVAERVANNHIKVVFDIPETNIFGYANDTRMKLNTSKIHNLGWKPSVGLEEAYRRLICSIKETEGWGKT